MTNRNRSSLGALALGVLILAACGDGGPTSVDDSVPPPGAAPSASFSVSDSVALASVTEVVFTAATGGLASYEWDFGDGTRATGQTVRKIYERAASYQVSLRVTGSGGASSNSSANLVVKSLDALWDDDAQQYGVSMKQTGRTFRGRTVFRIRDLTGATTGSVDSNLRVAYSTSYFPGVSDSFEGRLADDLDHISGKLTLDIFGVPFKFTMNFVRK
jgi:PKD repeat protein